MPEPRESLSSKQTLLLILVPMVLVVVALRLYLHLVHVRHVYPGGYLVHHLFFGILIALPAAFVLAFGARKRATRLSAAALGLGSGMILDEFTYLVMTKGGDEDYVSRVSLTGAIVLVGLALVLLLVLYRLHPD